MSVLRAYDFPGTDRDVRFAVISPGGFRILCELTNMAKDWYQDVFLTCGTEGVHKGQEHAKGLAYDFRTNDMASLEEKQGFVESLIRRLCDKTSERVFAVSGGWANDHFFAFLEQPGQPNEHGHVQVRQGVSYP